MTFGQIPPHPAALVESLRALGYSLPDAVADIVDNSISAGATAVEVTFSWNVGEPFASILDNGRGMSVQQLVEAMRLGGGGPSSSRPSDDLGRYGLGLKTAAFSQCRRLTVATMQAGAAACARWDLDLMSKADTGWELLSGPAPGSLDRLKPLHDGRTTGTLVLWESLCTGFESSQDRFLEALEHLERHLGMVFQSFLDGEARRIEILLNGRAVRPWDPFLKGHPATISKPMARLRSSNGVVEIRGHILPHKDRFSSIQEHEAAGGPKGWVAQQGFYVYRAQRLIVAGGWLGVGGSREWLRDEPSQLARIRIDIPNSLDEGWRVDVRKCTATPPATIRDSLVRIALDVRRTAREVYAHRGVRSPSDQSQGAGGVWRATSSRRYPYGIKRDHPAVQAMLDMSSNPELVEATLLTIERTVPLTSSHSNEVAAESEVTELVLAARVLMENLLDLGLDLASAIQRVGSTEPFNSIPDIASKLRPRG